MVKFASILLSLLIATVFLMPFIYTVSPYELNPHAILLAPSWEYPFGTDRLGRDILARVLQGGQTSLIIGFLSAAIASLVGLFIGINAGFFKEKWIKLSR